MSPSKLTPFEQAVCAWILRLPGSWTLVHWDGLTATQEAAFIRCVKGGFAEARLPVTLTIDGIASPIQTVWRVTGDYSPLLEAQIRQYRSGLGHGGKGVMMACGQFTEARLTHE